MSTRSPKVRFTLRSLVLFIVFSGLLLGNGIRMWKSYAPGKTARVARLSAADIAKLQANVKSPSVQTRLDAAIALSRSGLNADVALPLLEDLLQDESVEVRLEAIQSIGSFDALAGSEVPNLIAALEDANSQVRREAAVALWKIGPGAEAVPVLIDLMRDDDLRRLAIRMLGKMGPGAADAVPSLIRALEETKGDIRHDVILALMNLGPVAAPASDGLVRLLGADEPLTRQRAAMALGKIGPAAAAAVPALLDAALNDRPARDAAVQALHDIDRAEQTMLPGIQQALKSDSEQVRIVAAVLCRRIGPAATSAIPELVELLREDPPNDQATAAAHALTMIGTSAIPYLCQAMTDSDPKRRAAAACVIAAFGSEARDAVPALTDALDDEAPRVRASAVMALGKVGPDARDAVPAIVLLFKDGDVLVRKNAAWSLGDISNDDPDAIRELLSLTRDTDYMVRLASVSSLGAIHSQPDCVVPVFIEMLNTPQVRDTYGLSRTLVSALAEFGPDAKAAIPTLIKMMQRDRRPDHPVDHALVAHALGEIGTGSDEALACLIDMLSKRHIFISAEAAGRALRKLNPDVAREMVPSLITQLEDSERSTHDKLSTTVRTLAGLGPLAEAAVPSLTMLLPQDDTCQIANALGEVGPASSSAVAMLVDCLQSYSIHHGYRTPYILALGKIGPGAKEAVPVVTQSLSEPDSFDPRLGWSVAEQRERWESRVKLYAWSLGQIGAASREAVPKLLELSNYIEKTIHVPTPDLLVRRSGVQEDWLITLEGQINQQTVSQVVLGALEQIQSAAAHDTR